MTLSQHRREDGGRLVQGQPRAVRATGGTSRRACSHFEHQLPQPTGTEQGAVRSVDRRRDPKLPARKALSAGRRSIVGDIAQRLARPRRSGRAALTVIAQVEDITGRKRAARGPLPGASASSRRRRSSPDRKPGADIGAGVVTWSKELYRIFGLDPEAGAQLRGISIASIPVLERVQLLVEASIAAPESFRDEYPVVLPGELLMIRSARRDCVGD